MWLIWGVALPLIALNGWVVLQILAFFGSLFGILLTATLLSFLLDYPVRILQRLGVRHTVAVLMVLAMTISLLVILAATLLPTLIEQMNELASQIPGWITSSAQQLKLLESWAIAKKLPLNTSKLAAQLDERLASQLQSWSGQTLNFILDLLGRFVDVLLTFVMTFYLLLHGNRLWDGLFQWLPKQRGTQGIRDLLKTTFHNYFVGQVVLGTLIGIVMTIALTILGVPFALLLGIGIGVMALFPFGIAFSICVISIILGFQNIWLGLRVFIVAVAIDIVIENVIAPQLIGEFTGLNPIWIILALLIGARLGGFLGLVVAVPLTSFLKSWFEFLRPSKANSEDIYPEPSHDGNGHN
jgi:predicted PurR-regulated permease PerM